jgi:hypothetical protein
MDARIDFDINEAIKLYDSDPKTIPTPEAPQALQECEEDPEALSSPALINSELNPVVDAVAESPDAITRSSVFDTLQFLLKYVLGNLATPAVKRGHIANARSCLEYHHKSHPQLLAKSSIYSYLRSPHTPTAYMQTSRQRNKMPYLTTR